VPGSSRNERDVQVSSIVIDLALNKGPMNNGHDPIVTRRMVQTSFKLARQEEIPNIHVLEWRGRKWPGRRGQKVFLQTARDIVRVGKVKVFGQVHYLIESLVPKLGNFSIRESETDAAFAAIPHG
jgi:hypothetical protein